ncbi:MAG: hypothetical protein ACREIE_04520, partial [Nitrospiraceae bacterium]
EGAAPPVQQSAASCQRSAISIQESAASNPQSALYNILDRRLEALLMADGRLLTALPTVMGDRT